MAEGRADTIPIFLSEIPLLFRRRLLNLDVALISVSPVDKHGFCSLGPGVDCTRAAVQNAQFIIGLYSKQLLKYLIGPYSAHYHICIWTSVVLATILINTWFDKSNQCNLKTDQYVLNL